jgi:hypothetical protein
LAQATQPAPPKKPLTEPDRASEPRPLKSSGAYSAPTKAQPTPDDGTNQLLKWGGWILAIGIFFALLTKFALGGIGPQGPHTNSGWMALIVTMMCLPFGFLLFLLGALKWLRNRRQSRISADG